MTIPDRDLYTATSMLIREHGEEAHSIATNRAEELKAAGDEAGPLLGYLGGNVGKHHGDIVGVKRDAGENGYTNSGGE